MHLRMVIIIVVFTVGLCVAFIVADASTVKADTVVHTASKRIKRGLIDDSAKLLRKAGKFAPLIWRIYKAKRVLLKDAKLIRKEKGAGVYTKKGGKGRAENDFYLTFPTNVKIIDTDNGPAKVGYIDNYEVVLRYWKTDVNIQDTDIATKYTIRIVKTSYAKEFADIPVFVHYLN